VVVFIYMPESTCSKCGCFQSLSRYYWCLGRFPTSRSDQIRSVAQSCLTLCDPMNRSTPGLPVHHHTQSQSHNHTQSHSHKHNHTQSHTHNHTVTHTQSRTQSHTQSHTHNHTVTNTVTHTITHTTTHIHNLTHIITHTQSHTHTHTHTHTQSHFKSSSPLLCPSCLHKHLCLLSLFSC